MIDETEEKQSCEDVEHPVLAEGVAGTTGEELEESVAGEAEAQTVGDGPGQGDRGDREEGGDGDLRVVPLDLSRDRWA